MQKEKKVIALTAIFVSIILLIFIIWPVSFWYLVSIFFSEWGYGAIKYSVESNHDDQLTAVFKQESIDYRRHPFFVIEIYELDLSNPDKFRPIWSIKEKDGPTEEKLYSLTYGICPPGYFENAPAEPLKTGHYYLFISDVIRKDGPRKYEIIPYNRYKEGVKTGIYQDAKK